MDLTGVAATREAKEDETIRTCEDVMRLRIMISDAVAPVPLGSVWRGGFLPHFYKCQNSEALMYHVHCRSGFGNFGTFVQCY